MQTSHASIRLKSRLYFYAARVIDVYDGDTMRVDLDLGLGVWRHNQTIRLWKVNTPELRGPEREEGLKVRDFVRALVLEKPVLLRTILDKRGEDQTGKFGRLLGEVLVERAEGRILNVNRLLLQRGMAKLMGADGSMSPVAAPMPDGVRAAPAPRPVQIVCPYCGEKRDVDSETGAVAECPNCLDTTLTSI